MGGIRAEIPLGHPEAETRTGEALETDGDGRACRFTIRRLKTVFLTRVGLRPAP